MPTPCVKRLALAALALALAASRLCATEAPGRLLYITHSAGYRHEVIPQSQLVLKQLAEQSDAFAVTTTEDVAALGAESLQHYAAVMFYTSGELPLSNAQKSALLAFVGSGRGFIGVHSATDTLYTWPGYLELIGGYFNGHPWHQEVSIDVDDRSSPLVGFLAPAFHVNDEIYQISDFDYRGAHVLLRLDPASVDLGRPGVQRRFYGWPLAWTRRYGSGRVFYTALGHEASVWQDPRYQRMLLAAIRWSMAEPQ